MVRTTLTIATVYSSAQCVLSVIGSVGVILLFAGIPQLIYSPMVSAGNLLTFIMGAVLIMTMVAGNTFLNYKFRRMNQEGGEGSVDESNTSSESRTEDPEDKPPSYDAIITLDGSPPEYESILLQKPPKYEEIAKESYAACGQGNNVSVPASHVIPAPSLAEGNQSPQKVFTFSRIESEITEDERGSERDQNYKCGASAGSRKPEEEEQEGGGEPANPSLSRRDRLCVVSEAPHNTASLYPGESET